MDMSNKSLALLLVAAIVISLGGTLMSLNKLGEVGVTGGATAGSGQVNLTISQNTSCTVDTDVDFGSGAPTSTITISTESANAGNDFTDCTGASACRGIYINNTGNTPINVTFNSSVNGSELLGGTHGIDHFKYLIDVSEPDSADACAGTEGASSWTNIEKLTDYTVCEEQNASDSLDEISIEFNVTINESTPEGNKTATIYVSCEIST
ncbi:hypothetical protein KY348_05190 [Candidatus Woesearchaeota archaeon]|nr:hypothetical protein [Candidatus Woesearchaeota archaeon]